MEFHEMFRSSRLACGVLVALLATASASADTVELAGRKLLGFASTALQIASSSGVLGKGGGPGGLGGLGGGGQSGYIAQQALGSLQAQVQAQAM